jgi:hypothetical protein
MKRTNLPGEQLQRHSKSRLTNYESVVFATRSHGIIPTACKAGGMGLTL